MGSSLASIARRVLALWLVVWFAGAPALAAEAPPQLAERSDRRDEPAKPRTYSAPTPKIKLNLRAGRAVTMTGFAMFSTAAVMLPVGYGLGVYNFQGEWFEKFKYDRVFVQRSQASDPMMWTSFFTACGSTVFLFTGPLVEGAALRKLTHHYVSPGYVGLGFFLAGATIMAPTTAVGIPWLGASFMAGGLGLIMAQAGMNVHKGLRLSTSLREEVYGGHVRPQVTLVPVFGRTNGVALVGVF